MPTQVTCEAVAGEPLGVGKLILELPAPPGERPSPQQISSLRLRDADGRTHYPAVVGNLEVWPFNVGPDAEPEPITPSNVIMFFLFTGNQPLNVTVTDARPGSTQEWQLTVEPTVDPDRRVKMLKNWARVLWLTERGWENMGTYADWANAAIGYVYSMVARRTQVDLEAMSFRGFADSYGDTLGLLVGLASVRQAIREDLLLRQADRPEPADAPLPAPLLPQAVPIPDIKGEVAVEPLATRVPPECFYVRFASLNDYVWMSDRLAEWTGYGLDVLGAGDASAVRRKVERQLAMHAGPLARLMGDQAVAEMALVGTDFFLREGAALGVLYRASNSKLLEAEIRRQRNLARSGDPSVSETVMTVAGREVSLISRPDNAVRSFYVIHGDYQLVATSLELVRRFLAVGDGAESLGATAEFRWARAKMPLARKDNVFVYLSDAFFRNIVGPKYRVEMTRRMRAREKIRILPLARLAAAVEGLPAGTIDELITGGFLPKGFNEEPDGSRIIVQDGVALDSLRGAPGSFVPVSDVDIQMVTASESKAYEQFTWEYRSGWQRMDPAMAAVRRADGGAGHVLVEVLITPYARRHYDEYARYLAAPDNLAITPAQGDLLWLQASPAMDAIMSPDAPGDDEVLSAAKNLLGPMMPIHHVFGAMRDCDVPFRIEQGELRIGEEGSSGAPAWLSAYFGETPLPVLTLMMVAGREQQGDAEGIVEVNGMYTRSLNALHVQSPQRQTLTEVWDQLKHVQTPRRAQVRLRLAPLAGTKLSRLIRAAAYTSQLEHSVRQASSLDLLGQWFNINGPAALATVAEIAGAPVRCPLGGEFVPPESSNGRWCSTAWPQPDAQAVSAVPEDFTLPALERFRGADFEFSINAPTSTISVRLELGPLHPLATQPAAATQATTAATQPAW
jgi:hypothetical protein